MTRKYLLALGAVFAATIGGALAQTAYDNQGSDTSGFDSNGAITQNGSIVTNTEFQLLSLSAPAGSFVNDLSQDIYNGNSTVVDTGVILGLWTDSGTSGGPGTELLATGIIPADLAANGVTNVSLDGIFSTYGIEAALPADQNLWISVTFSNAGGYFSDTTAAELNDLSPATGGTPTVGNTDGNDWFASSINDLQGNGYQDVPNPSISQWNSGLDFGTKLDFVPGATPEPFTMGLGIAGIALAVRKRAKSK